MRLRMEKLQLGMGWLCKDTCDGLPELYLHVQMFPRHISTLDTWCFSVVGKVILITAKLCYECN